MDNHLFITLVYNASLLMVLLALYSGIEFQIPFGSSLPSRLRDLITGALIGLIGIALMANPWTLRPGLFFDARSILLGITGLFFGAVPTAIAVVLMGGFRVIVDGTGGLSGLSVILTSAGLGLAWRRLRPDLARKGGLFELYLFGVSVHLLMLACFFLLPLPLALQVLRKVSAAVLALFPVVTVLLGGMLLRQRESLQAKEALEASNRLLESIVENIPLMIFLKDAANLRFIMFNHTGEELLGYKREAMLNMNDLDFFPAEQAESFMARDREVLKNCGTLDIPEETVDTAKKGPRVLHTRKTCLKGPDGKPKYLLGVSEDITERKRAEKEKDLLEDQLLQSRKMETIGRLAGGVAHDFNNILTAIKAYGGFILNSFDPRDPRQLDVQEILDAADRAAALTRQLLAFSRRQITAPRVIDLNKTILDMTKMLRRLIGEDVKLETRLSSGACKIMADSGQMEQVVMNLVINSRDAMPNGGTITLETAIAAPGDSSYRKRLAPPAGPLVVLTARDNGHGMTAEVRGHAFEPFFTTKPLGRGTGLGLTTILNIIKQSRGEVDLESAPGKGTVFSIYLPLMEAAEQAVETGAPVCAPAQGHETVLLVDDDLTMRRLGERLLRSSGYTVISAADGAEALEVLARRGKAVDLLLTDVIMPGMTGRELAIEVASRQLADRTLYMSGYTDETIMKHGVLEPGLAFINKPFTSESLCLKLREVLDGPAGQAKA